MRSGHVVIRLKWKIFAFLLAFCALLLVILWLFQTVLLNDMYKAIRKNEIDAAVALVEKHIDSEDLQTVFDKLGSEKEIMVRPEEEFRPEEFRKILNSYKMDAAVTEIPDPAENADPAQNPPSGGKNGNSSSNGAGSGSRKMERLGPVQETLTRNVEFRKADGSTVSLVFHAIITPVDATVATLRVQLLFITGIMLLLAVLLAFLIARHVSRPIEVINKSAKALSKGDYDTRFSGKGFLEIEELSDTLNMAAGELSKVEGFRRELLTNIAHDLRTPLSLIYSYAEMMHDFPDEIQPEQTQIIMDEVSRLSSLVNDVFEISRLETGNQTQKRIRYSLTEQLASTIGRMEELLKKDGYSFCFEYDRQVQIEADQVKIAQVFYNLLLNAINYAGSDRQIEIRQAAEGGFVKVEVTDHGEGIPAESIPYIWDRYYKVDKKHKRAVTGTGLGLSIVKKIVESHSGTYGVESEQGTGSCFWFCIPEMGETEHAGR